MNIKAYHRQQKQMISCQEAFDGMCPPGDEELDFTEDEIVMALELALERRLDYAEEI